MFSYNCKLLVNGNFVSPCTMDFIQKRDSFTEIRLAFKKSLEPSHSV